MKRLTEFKNKTADKMRDTLNIEWNTPRDKGFDPLKDEASSSSKDVMDHVKSFNKSVSELRAQLQPLPDQTDRLSTTGGTIKTNFETVYLSSLQRYQQTLDVQTLRSGKQQLHMLVERLKEAAQNPFSDEHQDTNPFQD
jgi:hypothetical protein